MSVSLSLRSDSGTPLAPADSQALSLASLVSGFVICSFFNPFNATERAEPLNITFPLFIIGAGLGVYGAFKWGFYLAKRLCHQELS